MKMFGRGLTMLVSCTLTAASDWSYALHGQSEERQVLSREGTLMQIKQMNHLEGTASYIGTIIHTEKRGNRCRLWQDLQSDIFIVCGRVLAGLDLDKLDADNVNIVNDEILISLLAVGILSVDLENIEVYDIQTGSFNLLPMDKSVFKTVQEEARRQVLRSTCKAEILEYANRQTQIQLENLFTLAQARMSVYPAAVGKCG